MNLFFQKKQLILGLMLGLFSNGVIPYLYSLYQIIKAKGNLSYLILVMNYNTSLLTYYISLNIIINAILFTLLQNKIPFDIIKGIIIVTIIVTCLFLILKYFYF